MKLILTISLIFTAFVNMAQPTIKAVYFAQTHVVKFDYLVPNANEKLKLISDRQALIKVNLISASGGAAPVVKVKLELNSNSTEINLTGPSTLPTSFNDKFGEVVHSFSDSFTGIIPKQWVQPGLKITVITPTESQVFDNLSISAPNRIFMTNFEINAFKLQDTNFPNGWEIEFGSKLPTAEFKVQNVSVLFPEISAPPLKGTRIATRFNSLADYEKRTGENFGEHNDVSQRWKAALRDAAGLLYGNMKYITVSWSYTDRPQKGVGGNYSSVQRRGGANGHGIFIHEIGHALSLPHWEDRPNYPYKGDMHGIKAPSNVGNGNHAGPIWAYDDVKKTFIKPTITGSSPLAYKTDPMSGGGQKNPEPGYIINHFSDYSVNQMRNMLENHLVIFNQTSGKYAKWSSTTNSYSKDENNTGNVKYPVQREVDVISVMAAASSNTPQANIVYPPIGPYKSGIIDVFDPNDATDRANAKTYFCPSGGCDATLKILQGDKTKYIMLGMALDPSLAKTDDKSFSTKAVNLLASEGQVFKVELLLTPDAELNGLPANPTILATWIDPTLSSNDFAEDYSENIKVIFEENRNLKIIGFQDAEKANIGIFSATGQQFYSQNFTTLPENNFVLPKLASGIYIVHVRRGKGGFSRKIVVN